MELFRPDKPVNEEKEDKFQRYALAKRIAEISSIGKYPSSLVIGIYGKWGEGKSSVLNFIKKELPIETVIIDFNPWHFTDEHQLTVAFFNEVASALGKKLKTNKQRATDFIGEYSESIGAFASTIVPQGKVITLIGKFLKRLKNDTIEALKKRVDELIVESNTNFVVFVDDIDRLDAHEVQAVFKLVKLIGNFPRTSYILSFDDKMVAAALGPKYGDGTIISGYNYLEKIIQVPLQLPKVNGQALRAYTLNLLADALETCNVDLNKNESEGFTASFDIAFFPVLNNPRFGVRYANAVGFAAPLLKGETNISDLMIIEGIKTFYPPIYHFIRNNPNLLLRNFDSLNRFGNSMPADKEKTKKIIDLQLNIYPEAIQQNIKNLITGLFPQTRSVYQNISYTIESIQKWHTENRICSPQHFERYFSYVVQKGDISDIYFRNLLSDIETAPLEELRVKFDTEIPLLKPENFIFKLRFFIPFLESKGSGTMAILLGTLGYLFPETKLTFFSGRDEVVYMIRVLIENVNVAERFNICHNILQSTTPFDMAISIYKKISDQTRKISEEELIKSDELKKLKSELVDRFLTDDLKYNFFETLPEHALWSIFELFDELGRTEEVSSFLSNKLQTNDSAALKIIRIFTPTISSSLRPDVPFFKTNFSNESFHQIDRFSDIELIENKLKAFYGEKNYIPVTDIRNEELTDENLVALFQKTYGEIKNITSID